MKTLLLHFPQVFLLSACSSSLAGQFYKGREAARGTHWVFCPIQLRVMAGRLCVHPVPSQPQSRKEHRCADASSPVPLLLLLLSLRGSRKQGCEVACTKGHKVLELSNSKFSR